MNIPDTRTGQMDVFLPPAMDLDAAIRLNVTAALARTGEWPATIEYGTGRPHSPGVTSRLVTCTTGVPPRQDRHPAPPEESPRKGPVRQQLPSGIDL